MEYQKIVNLLENTPNQPTIFSTKNWVETNEQSDRKCNINGQIKFKTSTLRSNLCDYTVPNKGTATNPQQKKGIIKNCAPFTNCINEMNDTQIDNAKRHQYSNANV